MSGVEYAEVLDSLAAVMIAKHGPERALGLAEEFLEETLVAIDYVERHVPIAPNEIRLSCLETEDEGVQEIANADALVADISGLTGLPVMQNRPRPVRYPLPTPEAAALRLERILGWEALDFIWQARRLLLLAHRTHGAGKASRELLALVVAVPTERVPEELARLEAIAGVLRARRDLPDANGITPNMVQADLDLRVANELVASRGSRSAAIERVREKITHLECLDPELFQPSIERHQRLLAVLEQLPEPLARVS